MKSLMLYYFLSKKQKGIIVTNGKSFRQNNSIYVYYKFDIEGHEQPFVLDEVDVHHVVFRNVYKDMIKVDIYSLNINDLSVHQVYKNWRIPPTSPLKSYFYNVLGIYRLQWHHFIKNSLEYLHGFKREVVLVEMVRIMNHANYSVNYEELKESIFGINSKFDNSGEYSNNLLNITLQALKETGEISGRGNSLNWSEIKIEPSALNTLSKYNYATLEAEKNRRQSRKMTTLTFGLVTVGIVQVIVALITTLDPIKTFINEYLTR